MIVPDVQFNEEEFFDPAKEEQLDTEAATLEPLSTSLIF
jgi:hypothetical protein